MSIVSETLPSGATADGWHLEVLPEVSSTNTHAARLPAWTAIRASTQTAGRGRTPERRWVSDTGGLWLSAVLPCPAPRSRWEVLPLVAGWAVLYALEELGVSARLRWPNDVMVGKRKLAGLLVERYTEDTAVVGVGLNVFNHPDRADTALSGQTVRLADLASGDHNLNEIAATMLTSLRAGHAQLLRDGFSAIADDLNARWSDPRPVELTLVGQPAPLRGDFLGVDPRGRLRIATTTGRAIYDATQVSLLRELD